VVLRGTAPRLRGDVRSQDPGSGKGCKRQRRMGLMPEWVKVLQPEPCARETRR
jgi:hypothetical protein